MKDKRKDKVNTLARPNLSTHEYEVGLDIEALLSEKKATLRYTNGLVIEETKNDYLNSTQVNEKTRSYARNHPEYMNSDLAKEEKRREARLSRRRALQTIMFVGAIILAGVFFSLLLYPQSEMGELSRDNSDAKDRISALRQQIVDAEEGVSGITDMDVIRSQALALGMQDPNANQLVILPMPGNDKLITIEAYDEDGISEEALENSINNLAEYYRNNT